MIDITEIACESYKEDLISYDNHDYVINYSKYDWRMSYIAYDAMLKTLTSYRNLNQPDTDYETFGVEDNLSVISIVNDFEMNHTIFLCRNNYDNLDVRVIKGKKYIYYILR
ncbi:hypothetical protein AKUH4B114J_01290 [Apilactobacillus kunkeei]|uniref:hypothetical protein n=1 Tax=Apilactobacillus TaxID=2767877 RepID=UPI001C6F8CC2|nr:MULTISPECIES: hypothetical protein [Apilactobacillus]MBX8455011.1 hypothetical protein [Apilactobacillus kunkeei]MCK8618517.1 hypothetical protein [Apilactobacillus kunkeei]MDN2613408.1 hypothetical protein [Apilactobacillus sp. EABW-1NA]QYU54549.1 hypothetical protein K2W87_00615 [Apilactobacillus kunkeei]CAI2555435.1 hypothetical protein AKUH3B101X_01280 [Apilactobacillus kunkeei]